VVREAIYIGGYFVLLSIVGFLYGDVLFCVWVPYLVAVGIFFVVGPLASAEDVA